MTSEQQRILTLARAIVKQAMLDTWLRGCKSR